MATKSDTDIGERIKRLRSFRGLTCAELADSIGCTRPYLSAVENGRYPASTKILRKLTDALAVELEFFTQTDEPKLEHTSTMITREALMEREMRSRMNREEREDEHGFEVTTRTIPCVNLRKDNTTSIRFDEYPDGDTDRIGCPVDVADARAFALKIEGDEMAPLIPAGATVIVAPSLIKRENKPVLIRMHNGSLICRNYQAQNERLILAPANTSYPVQLLEATDVSWVYPVVRVYVDVYAS